MKSLRLKMLGEGGMMENLPRVQLIDPLAGEMIEIEEMTEDMTGIDEMTEDMIGIEEMTEAMIKTEEMIVEMTGIEEIVVTKVGAGKMIVEMTGMVLTLAGKAVTETNARALVVVGRKPLNPLR